MPRANSKVETAISRLEAKLFEKEHLRNTMHAKIVSITTKMPAITIAGGILDSYLGAMKENETQINIIRNQISLLQSVCASDADTDTDPSKALVAGMTAIAAITDMSSTPRFAVEGNAVVCDSNAIATAVANILNDYFDKVNEAMTEPMTEDVNYHPNDSNDQ